MKEWEKKWFYFVNSCETCLSNLWLVAGLYFYVVGVDIFIRNDDYVNRGTQDSPPHWVGWDKKEVRECSLTTGLSVGTFLSKDWILPGLS